MFDFLLWALRAIPQVVLSLESVKRSMPPAQVLACARTVYPSYQALVVVKVVVWDAKC